MKTESLRCVLMIHIRTTHFLFEVLILICKASTLWVLIGFVKEGDGCFYPEMIFNRKLF